MIYLEGDFESIVANLHHRLMDEAPQVDTGHWQSLTGVPHTATRELHTVCLETSIPQDPMCAALWVQPNLPWAEDHFQERVGGKPTNPGSQFMNWPWYRGGVEDHKTTGQFSHTYQERMWPRFANDPADPENGGSGGIVSYWENTGLRYRLGDLADVVALLAREPHTRQAFLPIWFPEDTGAHHNERVPCSLGYHFLLRGGLFHVTYFIRSCDFLRYLRDDVYMAMRLGQWVLGQLVPTFDTNDSSDIEREKLESPWMKADMGILTMNIISLHIFEGDMPKMRREAPPRP